jgi:UDP-N-acetyl-2-amino-2-deoxyglucuronate dehydrogenase
MSNEAETLRFAIIGCGVIGSTHADALAAVPGARLIAVADSVAAKAKALGTRNGVPDYDDAARMLDREHPDVVCICTPSGMHGAHACLAMRAGAHVVVEKPIEITLPAIDEMLRVRAETGRKMAVISQHRFDEASARVHELAQEGAFGRLVLGNAHIPWWRSQAYYDSGAWRGTWALDGGGVLMNQSIHSIDLLSWLMGSVHSLRAYTDTLAHRMETEDVAVAVLRFANGALGTIAATTGAYPGVTTRIELFGDQGSAIIADDRLAYLHLARDDKEPAGPYGKAPEPVAPPIGGMGTSQPTPTSSTTHAAQIADMVRAIRTDGTPALDGIGARHAVAIILGIYESARTGREVVLG